jgi:hypothetical protein
MEISNIARAEALLKERRALSTFMIKSAKNEVQSGIDLNGVPFEAEFLHLMGRKFVREFNEGVQKLCKAYMSDIDEELKKL